MEKGSIIMDSDPTPSFQNGTDQANNVCVFNEEFKYFLLPVSYSAVFILGLPLNLTAMWIFVAKMRPWSSTTVYMFNLALSDTLYLLSLPALVYYYADQNNWPFGEALCKTMRFLFYTNLYCSILFLTCISVHRYIGVCHPLYSLRRLKARYAHMFCVGVWISVSVCLIPNLIFVTVSPRGNDTLCHDTTTPEDFEEYVEYSTAVMSLLFGLPCLVIAGCYGLMARELMKPMDNGIRQSMPAYKRKSIKTIILVLTVFIICFLPFHVTRTIYYYARLLDANCDLLNVVNIIYKITRPLASANSCFDPVLYFLASENYQKRLVGAATNISNVCRRRLPVIHRVPATNKRGGLAVIAVRGTENTGSLGNRRQETNNHPDEIEVGIGTNDGNREGMSTERGGEGANNNVKWRNSGINMEANGNVGVGVAGEIRGENVVEGRNAMAFNDAIRKMLRSQSDNVSDRKRSKANGERRRFWSLRRMKGPQRESNLCDGEGTSSWNLLDIESQGGRSACNEGDYSKGKELLFLPSI